MKKQDFELAWMNPEDVAENPHNWRTHPENQMKALDAVISEVGWAGVALYNRTTGRLIDGHLRRELALKKGEEILVLKGDWTEDEELLLLSSIDPIAGLAVADRIALDNLLQNVNSDNEAIQEMLSNLAQDAGLYFGDGDGDDNDEVDFDDFDEVPEISISYRVIADGLTLEDAEMIVDAFPNMFEDVDFSDVKYEQVREKDE